MSNVNLEPFELSLWKDKLVKKIIPNDDITEDSLINIYRGLNTDEKDLSFWYLPRRWKGAKFNPISDDNKYKVNVDIDPPSERENSLVHIDFSTSNLDFKPDTYYTFLLHLDFSKSTHKLPNWDSYIKYNPDKASHYLISLIRQDVPDSQWNIPKPIFDSSVALSYNMNGFNLLNSELHNHDDAKLFVHKETITVDEQQVEKDVDHVVLTCFAKTNNFLSEKATVGMWSFLEAWVEDYWNADMEIYVFEETIKEENIDNKTVNVPQIYKRILNELSNDTINYNFSEDSIEIIDQNFNNYIEGKMLGFFRTNFPVKSNGSEISSPIDENGDFFQLKEEINTFIQNFYNDCINSVTNNLETEESTEEESNESSGSIEGGSSESAEGESSESIEGESGVENFFYEKKYGYLCYIEDNGGNFDDVGIVSQLKSRIAEYLNNFTEDVRSKYSKNMRDIFLKYFPVLSLPYIDENGEIQYSKNTYFTSKEEMQQEIDNFFQNIIDGIIGNGESSQSTDGESSQSTDGESSEQNVLSCFCWDAKNIEMNDYFEVQQIDEISIASSEGSTEGGTEGESSGRKIYFFTIKLKDEIYTDYWNNFWYDGANPELQDENKIYKYLNFIYGNKQYGLKKFFNQTEQNEMEIISLGLIYDFITTLSYIKPFGIFLTWFNTNFSNVEWDKISELSVFTNKKRRINTRNLISNLFLMILILFGQLNNIEFNNNYSENKIIEKLQDMCLESIDVGKRYLYLIGSEKLFYHLLQQNKTLESVLINILKALLESSTLQFSNIDGLTNILQHITVSNKEIIYLEEKKQFIFGEQDGPLSFAQEISFNENTKDVMHTLTFSLYNNYYDRRGQLVKNPYINLIHEEDKIKYHYKNKWYDLIITDTQLDNISNKIIYTAKDANVIELSKIGFDKTFNTELDNNVGTINELSEAAIEHTGWVIDNDKMEKFYQEFARPIIGGYIGNDWYIELSDYYYNTALEQTNLEQNNIKINSGSFIYLFYNDDFSNSTFKIIIPNLDLQEYNLINKNDYTKLNNILTNVNLYPSFKIKNINDDTAPSVVDHTISNTNIIISIPDFIDLNKEIVFDYSLRANDIVIKPITHYSVPLKRYVTEYTHTIEGEEPKTLYGYVESEYTTKALVSNLLPNGEDFTSLDGWITGAVNKYFKIENNLGAATRDGTLETITPYLTFSTSVESGSNINYGHGFVCNTELGYNFAEINKIGIGDEFVLRVQVERGENFTPLTDKDNNEISEQLILMETMRPYIYAYDNPFTLQSGIEAEKILPLADKQVISFIQEKRHQEQIKFDSKIINESSNASDGRSIYNDCYHLYYTYNRHNLVPVYWYQCSQIYSFPSYNLTNDPLPCIYVQQELAKKVCTEGYFKAIREVSDKPMGGHKSYCFTKRGWNEFRRLFDATGSASNYFSLKDFAIICDFPNSSCFSYETTDERSNPFEGATSIKYYLPMLFSDKDLLTYNGKLDSENKHDNLILDNIQKSFFSKKAIDKNGEEIIIWPWKKILENGEYYELKKDNSSNYRAFQYEGNMDYDSGRGILAERSQNDFDILMRMRMYWNCIQYSETDTCIFETSGMFCGKPIKISDKHYEYTVQDSSGQIIGPKSYTREELLDTHLGLFFTFDSTLYDDGGRGNTKMAISSVQLFRKYKNADGSLILPDKIMESNATPVYYLYDPEKNKNIVDKNDMRYEYIGTYLDDSYQVNLDLTGEKKNSITITESNSYNILQKLAEIFDAWLVIDVEHDEDGAVKLDDNYKPIKKIYFINSKYNDNFAGIKYGINLNKIDRKIDSNDIINKLIIKNNNNEFGKNKICSIVRSKYNLNGSNSIFNLNYLININSEFEKLKEMLYNKIYPRTFAYGKFLSDLIEQRAQQLITVSQTQATSEYNKLILNEAQEKLNSNLDKYNSLSNVEINDPDDNSEGRDSAGIPTRPIGYYIANNDKKIKLPASVQNIIDTFIFYNNLVNGFTTKYNTSTKEYNAANSKYNTLQDITDSVTAQRDSLLDEFQSLCAGRIREGAWSSEDYIDDDLYYLDGERQLKEFSVPRVSYTIDIVDLSSLPGYEAYDFNLRDKTTIEDPEIFGYIDKYTPAKEEIIITEKTTYPQSPEKNQIVVQNYKTNFSDLFQRMASTIQAVELGTLHYSNTNSSESIDARVTNNESNIQAFRKYNNL